MKTKILAVVVLGSLLVSCANYQSVDEDEPQRAVSFKTGLNRSKGVDNTKLTLESSADGIGLHAYRGTTGSLGGVSTDAAILVNNKMVYEASHWVLKNATGNTIALYWPDNGSNEKLSFYAYFPRNATGISNMVPDAISSKAVPKFDFTVADLVANQVDLLVARWVNPGNQPANPVGLTFDHATTKVAFAACTNVPDWQVTIHKVEIKNVYNTATYTYPTKVGPLDQAERNATWENYGGKKDYTLPLATTTVFDSTTNGGKFNVVTSQATSDSPFLLSQDLKINPNTPKLVVTYSVFNKGTNQSILTNAVKEFNIGHSDTNTGNDLTTVWNRGSIVTYKYTFKKADSGPGSQIIFSVDVNGWTPMEYSLD